MTAKHDDLKELVNLKTITSKKKPSDYPVTLDKELTKKMIADIEKSREEWERRI